jgi:hypothetical protein
MKRKVADERGLRCPAQELFSKLLKKVFPFGTGGLRDAEESLRKNGFLQKRKRPDERPP